MKSGLLPGSLDFMKMCCDKQILTYIEYSPLGSIGIDNVISKSCYKGTILQRNYYYFVKLHGKKIGSHNMTCVIPKCVL